MDLDSIEMYQKTAYARDAYNLQAMTLTNYIKNICGIKNEENEF